MGSAIQLYATGASGYGSASKPLLPAGSVTTDNGGSFNITNKYTCPSSSSLVYIVATSGNSGFTTNSNLALMAALGSCTTLVANASTTFIFINELTTVGSVWALAPFATGPANIGTSSTNPTGLVNAFADVNTLTNIGAGTVPGAATPAGATIPVAEIDTLADILAACVNSSGGTAGTPTTPCGMLFNYATPSGGTAPTDTITAALDIAKNPAHNVGNLYALSSPTAPFQPTLVTVPNDFTIAVNYTAGGTLSGPSGLAADASGNIWIANATGNTVTELSHTGAVLSGAGYTASLNAPSAIAFDTDGTVWVTNKGNSTVSRLTSGGTPYSGSPYSSSGGLSSPNSIAFDSLGTAWIGNGGNNLVTAITSGGVVTSFMPAGAVGPIAIGVNPH